MKRPVFLLWGLVAALLHGQALADSACWPERELLGQRAEALLWGSTEAGAQPVPMYTAQGTALAPQACQVLAYVRGDCSGEYAFLPLVWSAQLPGLAQVPLASGQSTWIRPQALGRVQALLPLGRRGQLLPEDARITVAPASTAANAAVPVAARPALQAFLTAHAQAEPITLQQALQPRADGAATPFSRQLSVQSLRRNAEGVWARVQERLVYSANDGLARIQGPVLRSGYVLHRDRLGVVQAVVEDAWCD
jgi:hypothetical protein